MFSNYYIIKQSDKIVWYLIKNNKWGINQKIIIVCSNVRVYKLYQRGVGQQNQQFNFN